VRIFLLFIIFAVAAAATGFKKPYRVLVFSKTKGFRHESIEVGKIALIRLGLENGFKVDTTENADFFNQPSLKKYKAVIFLSTTGDVLNDVQQLAFERFIEKGGGFVGIHAATDTEYNWPWYGQLVGAYFKSHPEIQRAVLRKSGDSDLTYNFKQISPDIKVLYTIDESSYKGGENGGFHPISWKHKVGKGRSFYTALGHTKESYSDPIFLKHLLAGIQYSVKEIK
jgi:type 1 glutamine amidotransferase